MSEKFDLKVRVKSDRARPVLELYEDLLGKFRTSGTSRPLLSRGAVDVISRAIGAVIHLQDRQQDWCVDQAFIDTSSDENVKKKGIEIGLFISPGVKQEFIVWFRFDYAAYRAAEPNDPEYVRAISFEIPIGTPITGPNGRQYEINTNVFILLDPYSEMILASRVVASEVGEDFNLKVDDILTTNNPGLFVVDDELKITQILKAGKDPETNDAYRSRIAYRSAIKLHSSTIPDYINWSLSVPGVSRVLIHQSDTPNLLHIYPRGTVIGSPNVTSSVQDALRSYLMDLNRKVVGVTVEIRSFTLVRFSIQITGLLPDYQGLRNKITTRLNEYFFHRFPSQFGDEKYPENLISLSDVYAVIQDAGATRAYVNYIQNTATGENIAEAGRGYDLQYFELAKIESLTWV